MAADRLNEEHERLYNALKLFQRTRDEIRVAGGFPIALKFLLLGILRAFVVFQFDGDGTAQWKSQPIGNALADPHALEMHVRAKAAPAFVGNVEDQQPLPNAGLIQPLLTMHLKARFPVLFRALRDGFAGGLSGLFSGEAQERPTFLPAPATTLPGPCGRPQSGF